MYHLTSTLKNNPDTFLTLSVNDELHTRKPTFHGLPIPELNRPMPLAAFRVSVENYAAQNNLPAPTWQSKGTLETPDI